MCTILPPEYFSFRAASILRPPVETRFRGAPEAYFVNASPSPKEILVREPGVTVGYYKRPDLNSDPQSSLRMGGLEPETLAYGTRGTLSIIDRFVFVSRNHPNLTNGHLRIKNLVRLEGGEVCRFPPLSIWKICKY